VLRKRPYLSIELCRAVLREALRREVQDGRIRHWAHVTLSGETTERILRVVTLEDGTTIHNAFLDRGYREDEQ
jgi:hypothetical protein